jgi:hypothetical protein
MTEQKIEAFWRDATAEDIALVMKGEKVEARFRDRKEDAWNENRYLGGFDATSVNGYFWISEKAGQWRLCQVYNPPQWYLDKPDPGEGYRLLEKFPDEQKMPGDQMWIAERNEWVSVAMMVSDWQGTKVWYRRRIEPVPQAVGSRSKDNIPSGWQKIPDDEPRLACDAYWSLGAADWVIIGDERVAYANRDKWPAIRQRDDLLIQGKAYALPKGLTLQVYKQGFEVF